MLRRSRQVMAAVLAAFLAMAVAHARDTGAGVDRAPPATALAPAGGLNVKAIARAGPAERLLLPLAAPAAVRDLPAPSARQLEIWRAQRATARAGMGRRIPLGFARPLPAADVAVPLAGLSWQRQGEMDVAHVLLRSDTAAALRAQFLFDAAPTGLQVVVADAAGAEVFAPRGAADMEWSPVVDGAAMLVELRLPAGTAPGAATLRIPQLSHLVYGARQLKADPYIGNAESCERDVACLAPAPRAQVDTVAAAVARIIFTDDGATYACTGTLLNDTITTRTPHLFTANHCLDGNNEDIESHGGRPATVARSFLTYWFFQAASCGARAQPEVVTLTGGATVVARSNDHDWALVRLNEAAPAGAIYGAWNANAPVEPGAPLIGIHHPAGDLKKVSQGSLHSLFDDYTGGQFSATSWATGVTERGSSGSGLFTWNESGWYELRGGLFGGTSSCASPAGIDIYSRLDLAFPYMSEELAPGRANPLGVKPVVEFYAAATGIYTSTGDVGEIDLLDRGVKPGWVRTGLRFLATTSAAAATASAMLPVCRAIAATGAVMLSTTPSRCAALVGEGGWTLADAAAFYASMPSFGACGAGLDAVYEFRKMADPRATRFTADGTVRDALARSAAWTPQGVAFCVPKAAPAQGLPSTLNHTGMWWLESESGWGVNVMHQDDVVFLAWYTYDTAGKAWWLTMTGVQGADGKYRGNINQTQGPAFNAAPYDATKVKLDVVGTGVIDFAGANSGSFAYSVNGSSQTKQLTRQVFGVQPVCTYNNALPTAQASNFQDLWWNPAESGWGLSVVQQGDTIFAAWFTYGVDGKPLWLTATAQRVSGGQYRGALNQTTGPRFDAVPFLPAQVQLKQVGTMDLAFADGAHGTFSYTVNGVSGSKPIVRTVFRGTGTVCR